jgi:signal transduction histidine kinase
MRARIIPRVDAHLAAIRHTAGMGVRDAYDDMKEGFLKGLGDDDMPNPYDLTAWSDRFFAFFALLARTALFGFLVALPNLPLLPWGKSLPMVVTLGAVFLSALPIRGASRAQLARFAGVVVLVVITLRLGPVPTTSAFLAGAALCAAASLAQGYPFVYGVVAGVTLGALGVRVSDANIFHAKQLLLSGQPFAPRRASTEALRIAGFLFLTALMHVGRIETDRLRSRAQDAEAARGAAVADERARIARELHDVVSHHVTAMTLQAEAAAMTGDRDALASVATAGRDALTELRRMLGVLRHPDDAEPTQLDPQPGLAQLDALAARSSSGPRVNISRRGPERPLAAGVELCVYRLVQEALTNAAKHGDATSVDVVLSFAPNMLMVQITDNGRPLVAPRVRGGGLGLIGMRERVSLLDGELSAGPRRDSNGYEVVARLPLES